MKKKKVIIIVSAVVVCGAVAGGLFLFGRGGQMMPQNGEVEQEPYTRTVTLETGSLESSITATGVVASANISDVTTDLKYTVSEILVSVGDSVNVGDVICTLDSSGLNEQIATEEEKLAENTAKLYETYTDKLDDYNEAASKVVSAQSDVNSTLSALNTANTNYDNANASVAPYQSAYDSANSEVLRILNENKAYEANLLNVVQTAQAHYDSLVHLAEDDLTKIQAKQNLDNAKLAYDNAVADNVIKLENANQVLKSAESELSIAKSSSNLQSFESAVTQAQSAYNQAITNLEQATTSKENALEAKNTAYESYEDSQTNDTLDELYEQVGDCTLTAQSSGKVTAVNATVGSIVSGNVVTIQDTSNLEIEISIPEYDISKVEIGMTVTITSDISENSYKGTLTQIAPTATGGGSSSSTFDAIVSVTSQETDLLIGTNAMVEIIISSKDDVYTVPIDAVGKDDAGNDIIFVQDENDTEVYNEVEVTLGDSNDFYVEIYGVNLEDGMIVRASADPEEALDTGISSEELEEQMGGGMMMPGMGGMTEGPSGGMPSGGGTTGGGMAGGGSPRE